MDDFAPPIDSNAIASTLAPAIAAAGLTVQAGQSMTITGSDFDTGTNVSVLVYGQTTAADGTLAPAQIQDATSTGAMFTLNPGLPSNSLYLIWPENSSGIGAPIVVNQTDAQWMSLTPTTGISNNDNTIGTVVVSGVTTTLITASTGQSVTVYGQNLTNGAEGSQSWVFLDSATSPSTGFWVPVTSANPYSIQFNVPSGSPIASAGTLFNVFVNNGLGENYSWSQVPGTTLSLALSIPSRLSVPSVVKNSMKINFCFARRSGKLAA
jgi:hypothetical protein